MSQENVDLVRSIFEIWERGDYSFATGQLSDEIAADVIWDMSTFRGWPDQPVFHGLDGFTRFDHAWREPYDDWTMAVEQVLDAGGDRVVAVLVQRGRLRGSDAEARLRYGIVFAVESGQIRRGQVYMTVEEALEAVGLRE